MSVQPDGQASAWTLLPLIRVTPDHTSVPEDPFDDVLGMYEDAVVIFRKRRKIEVPVEAGDERYLGVLKQVDSYGKKRIASWQEIAEVHVSKRLTRGSRLLGAPAQGHELHFHFSDGYARPMFFPNQEGERVVAALRERIQDRIRESVDPMPRAPLRPRLRPVLALVGFIPGLVALLFLALLPVLVIDVAGVCLDRIRGTDRRRIAGPLAILTMISFAVCGLSFCAFGAGPGLLKNIGAFAFFAGAFLAPWIIPKLQAILASHVLATQDGLPKPPEQELSGWQKLLQPYRRYLFTRLFSIGCKALGIVAYMAATVLLLFSKGAFDIPKRELTKHFEGRSQMDQAEQAIEQQMDEVMQNMYWSVSGPILGLIVYIPATALIYLGYRLGARSADDALSSKRGPPTIYLRSFADDGRHDFNPTGTLSELLGLRSMGFLGFLGPLANVNPIRLLRLCVSTNADTAEEQVSQYFRRQGPFMAIGRPGEFLTPGGADRDYVDDEQWQHRVRDWLSKAGTVVVQPSSTAGVWWEIEQALRTVPEERLLFCLVNYQGDQHGYEQFAPRFERIVGVRMPRFLGNRCFVWLENGQPQFAAAILRWPLSWPISGCAVDFAKTLKRFRARTHAGVGHAEMPHREELFWGINALAALIVWPFVAILPAIAIGTAFDGIGKRHQVHQYARKAAATAEETDFVEHSGVGYHWRLRRAWNLMDAPAGTKMFTLRGTANACVIAAPAPPGEPALGGLTALSAEALQHLEYAHGATARVLVQKEISLNGYQWLETVFDIDSKKLQVTLRYLQRVTRNANQAFVAFAWTGSFLAGDLEGRLREALDGLTPISLGSGPPGWTPTAAASARSPKPYQWTPGPGWKEVPAIQGTSQTFTNDSGARATVVVRDVAGDRAACSNYAAQFLKGLDKPPGFEIRSNQAFSHEGMNGWIVLLKYASGDTSKFVLSLFILDGNTLFQVTGDTIPPGSDISTIEEAVGRFRVAASHSSATR